MKKHFELKYDLPQVETTFEDFYLTPQGQWFYEAKKKIDYGEFKRMYREKQELAIRRESLKLAIDKFRHAIWQYKHCANFKEETLEDYRQKYEVLKGERYDSAIEAFPKLTKEVWRAIKHKHISELYIRIYPSMYHIVFDRSNSTVSEYVNSELRNSE